MNFQVLEVPRNGKNKAWSIPRGLNKCRSSRKPYNSQSCIQNMAGPGYQRALILIDHGSKLPQANDQVAKVAALVAKRCPKLFVTFAHMELAKPDLMEAFTQCVENNARNITVCPFFLFPGKHSTVDIPQMAYSCATQLHDVSCKVVEPLGVHEKLVDIVLERAGIIIEEDE